MGCTNSKSEGSLKKIILCPNEHAMKYKHFSNKKNTCSNCYGQII